MPAGVGGGNQEDPKLQMARGQTPGVSTVHKFGRGSIGTTAAVIGLGTPAPFLTTADEVRVRAGGNAADTAALAGAREISIEGLDETGALVSEAVATAGASASATTTKTFIRVFRAWVSAAGTYHTTAAVGSNTAAVVIETEGGIELATIAAGQGQTQAAHYCVPLGKTAYIQSTKVGVDGTRTSTFWLYQRRNILTTSAPVSARRLIQEFPNIDGPRDPEPHESWEAFPALTDLWFEGAASAATTDVIAEFELVLVDS